MTPLVDLAVLKETVLAAKEPREAVPVAWLKKWSSVGMAQSFRRVDLTPDCELWLQNMFPTITPLYTSPPATQSQTWDADATSRLRSIVNLLGLQSCVPDGDLTGYEFSAMGFVHREIERLMATLPAAPGTDGGDAVRLTGAQINTLRFAAEMLEGNDCEDTAGDVRAIIRAASGVKL